METAILAAIGFAGVVCLVAGLIAGYFAGYYTPRNWDRPTAIVGKQLGTPPCPPDQHQALVIVVLGLLLGAALAALAQLGLDATLQRMRHDRIKTGEYAATPRVSALPTRPIRSK